MNTSFPPAREIAPDPVVPPRYLHLDRLTARLPVRCQRCQHVYKLAPCVPEVAAGESTGICPACYPLELARYQAEIAELRSEENARQSEDARP